MGKLVDKLRKEAKAANKEDRKIDIDLFVLWGLNDIWTTKKIDAGRSLPIGWGTTPDAIPAIEKSIEEGKPDEFEKWTKKMLDDLGPDALL